MRVFKWLIKEHPQTKANRLAHNSFRALRICLLLWPLTWILLVVIYEFYDDPYNIMVYLGSYVGFIVSGLSLIVPGIMAAKSLLDGTSQKVEAVFTAAVCALGFFGVVAYILSNRGPLLLTP